MNLMSFQRPSQPTLCFPGEEARETWLGGADGLWKRVDYATSGVMGVEAIAFDSAPFWSLNADAQDEAVSLRWEGFGLPSEGGARLWTHWGSHTTTSKCS